MLAILNVWWGPDYASEDIQWKKFSKTLSKFHRTICQGVL